MVYLMVDGELYGVFDVATSFRIERELREDFPGSEIDLKECQILWGE